MAKVARMTLSEESVLSKAFSIERMKATQNSPLGIINMFVQLVKSENPRGFAASNIRIGGKEDNYYLLYYCNGIRYKIFKDGKSMISSADAFERFEEQEKELATIVDTAVVNEISRCLLKALSDAGNLSIGQPKLMNADGSGHAASVVIGVRRK